MSIDDNDYELTNNRVLDDNKSQLTRFMNTILQQVQLLQCHNSLETSVISDKEQGSWMGKKV